MMPISPYTLDPVIIQRDKLGQPVHALIPEGRSWYDVVVSLEREGWYAARGNVEENDDHLLVTLKDVRSLTRFEKLRPFARGMLRLGSRILSELSDAF